MSKSNVGAKGKTMLQMEGTRLILSKVGGAVTKAEDVKQEMESLELPPMETKAGVTGAGKRRTSESPSVSLRFSRSTLTSTQAKPLVSSQPR